jgi:hypothetical protein
MELIQGALVCQPRFNVNGDGTLTDNQTGLMWEITSSNCNVYVTCYTNTYTWSTGDNNPDGTLYTMFLAILNRDEDDSGTSTCFANHCDWRIPTVVELESILLAPYPCGTSPCIDPAFGPTQPSVYWSSTSTVTPDSAWFVNFTGGTHQNYLKTYPTYARAVRGSR